MSLSLPYCTDNCPLAWRMLSAAQQGGHTSAPWIGSYGCHLPRPKTSSAIEPTTAGLGRACVGSTRQHFQMVDFMSKYQFLPLIKLLTLSYLLVPQCSHLRVADSNTSSVAPIGSSDPSVGPQRHPQRLPRTHLPLSYCHQPGCTSSLLLRPLQSPLDRPLLCVPPTDPFTAARWVIFTSVQSHLPSIENPPTALPSCRVKASVLTKTPEILHNLP